MFALFNHDVTDVDRIFGDNMRSFEFDVELDLEDDMMETLELPEVFSGRYLHDFMVNLTVIVDTLGRRCFIMKLDRNTIPKPKNIFDYLNKHILPTKHLLVKYRVSKNYPVWHFVYIRGHSEFT